MTFWRLRKSGSLPGLLIHHTPVQIGQSYQETDWPGPAQFRWSQVIQDTPLALIWASYETDFGAVIDWGQFPKYTWFEIACEQTKPAPNKCSCWVSCHSWVTPLILTFRCGFVRIAQGPKSWTAASWKWWRQGISTSKVVSSFSASRVEQSRCIESRGTSLLILQKWENWMEIQNYRFGRLCRRLKQIASATRTKKGHTS